MILFAFIGGGGGVTRSLVNEEDAKSRYLAELFFVSTKQTQKKCGSPHSNSL